jgi:hypothetical protein
VAAVHGAVNLMRGFAAPFSLRIGNLITHNGGPVGGT